MENKYFAARESKECASALLSKIEYWDSSLRASGFIDKLQDLYAAYHGAYYNSVGEAHQITFAGENDELVQLVVNHLRNIARHMLTMTTSTRPAMECRAINTDFKSVTQTYLGNGLLDYYTREKKLEEYLKLAVEYSLATSLGWVKMSWNKMLGEVINKKEIQDFRELKQNGEDVEIPEPEYEGDVEFNVLSALDVIMDLSKEGRDFDWIITRTFKNRYDLIAKYPELENEIMAIESKDQTKRVRMGLYNGEETDDIPVLEFYHRRSEALPNGKYMLFVSENAILYEGDLPYRRIPVFPIYSGRVLGTPLGYSPLFDLLPIQDALNSLNSAALSNNTAFGVQTILNPSGSNIDVTQLANGLSIMDYNPQGGKPEALNLTKTAPELYNLMDRYVRDMETLSAVNSATRGNPEASLRSGTALAMIQTNAIQFMSGLQQEYIYLMENVGICLIEILQDFADSPRIAAIVGKSGRTYMKEFKGEDLRSINRVIVDVANPIVKTISGRVQMADNLLQYGKITPDQYVTIINTGKLEMGTEDVLKEEFLIRGENESFLIGIQPSVLAIENHPKHILYHKGVLNDNVLKNDSELVQLVLNHINEHIQVWRNTDPTLLQALGIQPLAPVQALGNQEQTIEPSAMELPANLPAQQQSLEGEETFLPKPRMPEGMENSPLTAKEGMEQLINK